VDGRFHGYPWLIHKLIYRRANSPNVQVRGYKEQGNINTPMELAIRNQIDRFDLVIDAIDRVPALRVAGARVKEKMKNQILECQHFAYSEGQDLPAFAGWQWPER
jgi:xylulose-5-phosphate/fructose-6-phosphate phosphoketolase